MGRVLSTSLQTDAGPGGGFHLMPADRFRAEPPLAGDGEQPLLLRRSGCSPRLKRSVEAVENP
jgi:hypothetical protein